MARRSVPSPIYCAIDMTDQTRAKEIVTQLDGLICGVKLGLEFFCANGGAGVCAVAEGRHLDLFLDLKLLDIPTTVAGAIRALWPLEARFITVHCKGGMAMMKAAAAAAAEAPKSGFDRPRILGVTILTHLPAAPEEVLVMAREAKSAGLDGIVCSAKEAAFVRSEVVKRGQKPPFHLIVPGIRPSGHLYGQPDDHDPDRTATPVEAISAGADFIVVGRPITHAANPGRAAAEILDELREAEPA